jgi:hypothetical protein
MSKVKQQKSAAVKSSRKATQAAMSTEWEKGREQRRKDKQEQYNKNQQPKSK